MLNYWLYSLVAQYLLLFILTESSHQLLTHLVLKHPQRNIIFARCIGRMQPALDGQRLPQQGDVSTEDVSFDILLPLFESAYQDRRKGFVEVLQEVMPAADNGLQALGCRPADLPADVIIIAVLIIAFWREGKTRSTVIGDPL